MNILFSIILPTYNRAHLITRAIESVLAQTYTHWELIVVDDGSTDNTKEVVGRYSDNRIKYMYQENVERSAARNNGILKATGNYICFLDSDDYVLPSFLTEFENYITQHTPNYKTILFADTYVINSNSPNKQEKVVDYYPASMKGIARILYSPIGVPRICVEINWIRKFLFNPSLYLCEDMELICRMIAHKSELIKIEKYTVGYLEHDERSYRPDKIDLVEKHVKLVLGWINEYKPFISSHHQRLIKGREAYLMARTLFNTGCRDRKVLLWSLKACFYSPTDKTKENLFFIWKSIRAFLLKPIKQRSAEFIV